MPLQDQVQLSFGGGANPTSAPHLLAEDEVASATNIDFGFERGAAHVRRGCAKQWAVATTGNVKSIYRKYNAALASSPFYVHCGNTVYRGVSGTFTAIGTATGDRIGITAYQSYAFIAPELGTLAIKDDGTNATDWIKQVPGAPTVTGTVGGGPVVTATYTVLEGTPTGTAGTMTGTVTATVNASTYRLEVDATPTTTNLSTHTDAFGTYTIGDLGYDVISIAFSDPAAVKRISRDYSVGGTAFANYWHTELDLTEAAGEDASVDAEALAAAQLTLGTSTDTTLTDDDRTRMLEEAQKHRQNLRTQIGWAPYTYSDWIVPRPKFEFVGAAQMASWANVQRVRVVVEATESITVNVKGWLVIGNDGYPLTDQDLGYAYWVTWAALDTAGNVLGESAPSPPSGRVKPFGAQVYLVSTHAPTGNHGITHRIFYRQGGYLQYPYAVSTQTLTTTALYDTVSDMQALSLNNRLKTANILPHAYFPNNIVCASEPFYDRLIVGHENYINWSLPGQPDSFLADSYTTVSHKGDEVYGLIPWANSLVVVNRDSVYEVRGNNFEGADADYELYRTGAKHGGGAPRTIIKTPYGIPLLNADGLYMYVPGQGVDVPLEWVMAKIGDAWKGASSTDPAVLKGNRVPGFNSGYLYDSCAAFYDNRLYLGVPTGTNTLPSTLFVLDFPSKQTWWYTYPFTFLSLFWDHADRALYAGSSDGVIMKLETGLNDQNTAGTAAAISWMVRTRQWTTPADTVLENLSIEYQGGNGTASGVYDGTTTVGTLGTLTSATRVWTTPALAGTVCSNAYFEINGTSSATRAAIHNIVWDAMVEPKRVSYFKTEHDLQGTDNEKLWDVHYADLEIFGTGNVLGTVFVDNTAVMTKTFVGPTSGRKIHENAYPSETYGHQSQTVYNAAAGIVFKHWQSRNAARPEPPRVNSWRTDIVSLEENRLAAADCDVNPYGTVLGTVYVDNTAVTTLTATGTKRQSYTWAAPADTYGRTVYTQYTGTAFKHYNTWYHLEPEPDRLATVQYGPVAFASDQNLKTWVAELNPLGSCTGTLFADGTAINTSVFTGSRHTAYNVGLDVDLSTYGTQAAIDLKVIYSGAALKHYKTDFEAEPKPFGKKTWLIRYTKLGGPSRLDIPRWFALDVEPSGTATVTSVWDVDGAAVTTNTLTFTRREWRDEIPFPPGGQGQLFQHRLWSSQNFKIWSSTLDMIRVGPKGVTRLSVSGRPT